MPEVELSAIQAAVVAENTDCISGLFHNGATIAKAVSFAVKQSLTKLLQSLLDLGQDPDDMVDNEDCVTSLLWAAAKGYHECVQAFLWGRNQSFMDQNFPMVIGHISILGSQREDS